MEYVAAKRLSLKAHPQYNEQWLQQRIHEDPSLIGIKGDLWVQAERRQPFGGRLDLLLVDEEAHRRYEVEIQLGATDPSHIIRTIEYWDHERSRHPSWEHVAVLVAEDVTSRFLNVIRLFNSAIPIMAIQINALQVGDHLTINATTVLDLTLTLTEEEEAPSEPTSRQDWELRASYESMALVDELHRIVQDAVCDHGIELSYKKHFIGMTRQGRADNLVTYRPRKSNHVLVDFRTPLTDELETRLTDAGLDLGQGLHRERTRMRLTHADLTKNDGLIRELIHLSADVSVAINQSDNGATEGATPSG